MPLDPQSAVALGTAAIGLVQTGLGFIGKGKRTRELNALVKQRKAFETPDEIFNILNATQSRASTGLGAETLNYLTTNNDRAFSSAVGSLNLLGGDPNSAAAIFDQNFQGLMKIGSENQAANFKNWTQYLGALNTVAENNAAEQVSKDNLLKDQIQAKAAAAAQANQNIQNGINTTVSGLSSYAAGQLGEDKPLRETTVMPLTGGVRARQALIPTATQPFNPQLTPRRP